MTLDIEALLTYPTESDDWLVTVLVGGVLILVSFLVLPAFALYGYLLRVIRAGMDGTAEPPAFDDWGSLLVEGLVAFVVFLVYQLIPLVVFVVTVGGSVAAFAAGGRVGAGLGFVGLFGGLALTVLVGLVFSYVGLIGVANYAREGKFAAGFDVEVITGVATSSDYAVPWLVAVVVFLVASLVASVPILGLFVLFYASIVGAKLVGEGFAAAHTPGRAAAPAGELAD